MLLVNMSSRGLQSDVPAQQPADVPAQQLAVCFSH
jgi:hypothetical protein